ncbi:hypothetical protein DDE05_43430, partial [Streptomyces cavourensis]
MDHVIAENGYQAVDIRRLTPAPAGPGLRRSRANRENFRRLHLHEEDVVRFLVAGVGCHYLHAAGQVYALVCTAGDLLSVPSRTGHWFDAGATPRYTSVRFLRGGDRSGVRFPPGDIGARFPTLDDLLALPERQYHSADLRRSGATARSYDFREFAVLRNSAQDSAGSRSEPSGPDCPCGADSPGTFGHLLRAHRERRGLSLTQLAGLVHFDRGISARWRTASARRRWFS